MDDEQAITEPSQPMVCPNCGHRQKIDVAEARCENCGYSFAASAEGPQLQSVSGTMPAPPDPPAATTPPRS